MATLPKWAIQFRRSAADDQFAGVVRRSRRSGALSPTAKGVMTISIHPARPRDNTSGLAIGEASPLGVRIIQLVMVVGFLIFFAWSMLGSPQPLLNWNEPSQPTDSLSTEFPPAPEPAADEPAQSSAEDVGAEAEDADAEATQADAEAEDADAEAEDADDGSNIVRDLWLYTFLELGAIALLGWRAIVGGTSRWTWATLAAALTLWTSADVILVTWVANQDPEPYPSISDWLYLASLTCMWIAVLSLLRSRIRRPPLNVWLDAILVALSLVAYLSLIGPSVFQSGDVGEGPAAAFITAADPVTDIVLLGLLIAVVGVCGWRVDRTWMTLLAAATLMWICDTLYLLTVANQDYEFGSILDSGWLLAIMFFGFAAWRRQSPQIRPEPGMRAAAVPIAATGTMLLLLIFGGLSRVPWFTIALAGAAILVGSARVAQAFWQASGQAEAKRQAQTDELTGLPNRRLLNQRLDEATVAGSNAPGAKRALLMLDIDGFKEINDALGHQRGDEVLRSMVPRLHQALGPDDLLARIGGDEFAILLGPGTDDASAASVAAHIRQSLTKPLQVSDLALQVDVSLGIVLYPAHARSREDLLRCADLAMYRAKRSRLGSVIFDPELDGLDRGRVVLIQELREAVVSDQLFCDYQPKLDLASDSVSELEALVRWRHPERGLLPPDGFLPLAEAAGLMHTLADRVLDLSLNQIARWRAEGLASTVAVNLSMTNLLDPELPRRITRLLQRYALPPTALILEATETVLMTDRNLVRGVLNDIRQLGVILSIDDYGSAYSSLAQLRELRASELKLDSSFIAGLATNSVNRSIVRATADLAHDLSLRMVAEGVESAEDLAAVRELGCDLAQGYYICVPGPPEEITNWLRARQRGTEPGLPLFPHLRPVPRNVDLPHGSTTLP